MTIDSITPNVFKEDTISLVDAFDAYMADLSSADQLLVCVDTLSDLISVLQSQLGSAESRIAQEVRRNGGVLFLRDGRSLRTKTSIKRTVRQHEKIRDRVLQKALAATDGELTGETVERAIEIVESLYVSPSTTPKWGGLKSLGFSSWSEVADEEELDKGYTVD